MCSSFGCLISIFHIWIQFNFFLLLHSFYTPSISFSFDEMNLIAPLTERTYATFFVKIEWTKEDRVEEREWNDFKRYLFPYNFWLQATHNLCRMQILRTHTHTHTRWENEREKERSSSKTKNSVILFFEMWMGFLEPS